MPKRIVIDKGENTLRFYEGDRLLKTYRVGTGRDPAQTPEGSFTIVNKVINPSWRNPRTGEVIPGGTPRNPLGTRWLGLSIGGGSEYGIHGTNEPGSIGHHVSHGCVRMQNSDVEELFRQVPIGTRVVIQP
jgi:lipoprotein-anchoring transpeptidase ErfK/SrfK